LTEDRGLIGPERAERGIGILAAAGVTLDGDGRQKQAASATRMVVEATSTSKPAA